MNWHTLALAGALVLSVPPVFAAPSLNAGAVLVVDADQGQNAVANGAYRFIADRNPGLRDALDQSDHAIVKSAITR